MTDLWYAPDGEKIVIDFLYEHRDLLGCGVSSIKPSTAEWLQVQGTGGSTHSLVADWCQITLTAWADGQDWGRARAIIGTARALIEHAAETGMVGGTECYGVEWLALPYNNQDPVTGRARVTGSLRLALRGHYSTPLSN